MKSLRVLMWASLGLGLLGLHGCRERVVVARERYPSAPPQYVVVREPPPPMIVETRPPPPRPGHVYVEGYWHWNSGRYAWQQGHWVAPPSPRAVWVAPRYERHEQEHHYIPGHWAQGGGDSDRDRH